MYSIVYIVVANNVLLCDHLRGYEREMVCHCYTTSLSRLCDSTHKMNFIMILPHVNV